MIHLARKVGQCRWLAMLLCLSVAGCFSLDEGTPENPSPPVEDPTPDPEPDPEPDPTPEPGTLSVVVDLGALTVPEGGSASIPVRLSAAPDATATVRAELVGGTVFSLAQGTFSFDASNWDVAQTVEVTAASDADTANDWGRISIALDGGNALFVDVTQQDTEGTPVESDGVGLKVKDSSGAGAIDYPVTTVIPLPYGAHHDTTGFRILAPDGSPVPAQFKVHNRWWARDGSIRHVQADFQVTVAPDSEAVYTFETSGGEGVAGGVAVSESGGKVTVDTGVLKFTVKRDGFNLFDEVWLDSDGDGSYESSEKIVSSSTKSGPVFTGRLAGDVQRPADRDDLRIVVEESGPMRAVIRVSGLTVYNSTSDHTHGFAVRFYAYAGRSQVKVDYQLQNSAKNVRHAWPLYFEDVSLNLDANLSSPTVRLTATPGQTFTGGAGHYLFQEDHGKATVRTTGGSVRLTGTNEAGDPSHGWADVSNGDHGVFVAVRHMAEMWPNGIEVDADGDLAVRLWPKWSQQWINGGFTSSGLYWLEDMQHVVKEVLFYFHGPDAATEELNDLARNFQKHPIAFVPRSWYYQTKVTLDLGGILPTPDVYSEGEDGKRVYYSNSARDATDYYYNLGWRDWGGNSSRKRAGGGGGWPDSSAQVVGTERVDAWLISEARAVGDLNCRPVWMAEYDLDEDYERLGLIHWYFSAVLRAADEDKARENGQYMAEDYLPGTGWTGWTVWDNQHAWSYHIEEFYNLTGNLWIRDWYDFMAEFRLAERATPDHPNHWHSANEFSSNARGEAHSWATTLQAYRVTGDSRLLDHMRKRLRTSVLPNRSLRYGIFNTTQESPFQVGYFSRAMIQLLTEVRGHDHQLHDEAFQVVWGIMDWNSSYAQYAYYLDTENDEPGAGGSAGSAVVMVDPAAWFGLHTGDEAFLDQLRTYITDGLNGGSRSYGGTNTWGYGFYERGGFVGRLGEYVSRFRLDPNPPAAITDLQASAPANSRVRIQWTTPSRAARFHVVWTEKPLQETYSRSADVDNPWAGTPVGNDLEPRAGEVQSLEFDAPSGTTIHVAVFTFDADHAMSRMSNVATITVP